jgi:hemolysin III
MRQRSSDGSRYVYSRAERLSDAAVHVLGVTAALLAVPVLIAFAIHWRGDHTTVLAASVYAATLVAMLTCSALYHMTASPAWKGLLRRMDHSAIYLKIAGTYTPFAVLTGAHAGPLLAMLWGAAFVGVTVKLFDPARFRAASLGLCLGMGWAAVLVGDDMLAGLSERTFMLMLVGGILYTAGVVFHLWEALPFHNTIWHVFVLAATAAFYAAVLVELQHAPGGFVGPAAPGDAMSLLQAMRTAA